MGEDRCAVPSHPLAQTEEYHGGLLLRLETHEKDSGRILEVGIGHGHYSVLFGECGEYLGVDLDEELTRLVLYQQAYGASARLLAVTDQMFGELMAVVD